MEVCQRQPGSIGGNVSEFYLKKAEEWIAAGSPIDVWWLGMVIEQTELEERQACANALCEWCKKGVQVDYDEATTMFFHAETECKATEIHHRARRAREEAGK